MKAIKLKINNKFHDAFLYMGRLFVITEDMHLKYITNGSLFKKYLKTKNQFENEFINYIFFENNKIPENDQKLKQEKDLFDIYWQKYSSQKNEIKIDDSDLIDLCLAPSKEPLDFTLYSKKAFIGNRDGLYECQLNIDIGITQVIKGFEKIFDSKSINLNPRIGELLISTKKDGLFRGSIKTVKERTQIIEKPLIEKSIRASWLDYNFVNYEDQHESSLFLNETIVDNKSKEVALYRLEDNSTNNIKISEFGKRIINLDDIIKKRIHNENIVYSFNSLNKSFALTTSGNLFYDYFDYNNFQRTFDMNKFGIHIDIDKFGIPLSAHPVSKDFILEFFDRIIFIKDNKIETLSLNENKQLKTFSSSKRYRNLILSLTGDFIEIITVYPYSQ